MPNPAILASIWACSRVQAGQMLKSIIGACAPCGRAYFGAKKTEMDDSDGEYDSDESEGFGVEPGKGSNAADPNEPAPEDPQTVF